MKIAQIDVRPEHLGRRSKLDLAVWGDAKETLRCLIPRVKEKKSRRFLDRMLKKHADALEGVVKAYTRKVDKHVPIHPEYVAAVLDEMADDDAVFTVDTGMCNCLGRPLHLTQRPPAHHRFLLARLDGERAADGDRRPVHRPAPAGRLHVR